MTEKEIIEGNRFFAEFITGQSKESKVFFDLNCTVNELKYHSSWDWLMPVVEKIEHLYADETSLPRFTISSHDCNFAVSYPRKYKSWIVGCYSKSPEKIKANSKIEAAWKVALEFIKWYNSQNINH